MIVTAKLDFGNVDKAREVKESLAQAKDSPIKAGPRAGGTLLVRGKSNDIRDWLNDLRSRGVTKGLVHAGLMSALTRARPEQEYRVDF